MPLSTAERPINIKDLILEEPERQESKALFDVEGKLMKVKEMMVQALRDFPHQINNRSDLSPFVKYAAHLRLLFPNDVDLFTKSNIWEDIHDGLQQEVEGIRSKFDYIQRHMSAADDTVSCYITEWLTLVKILFPHRLEEARRYCQDYDDPEFSLDHARSTIDFIINDYSDWEDRLPPAQHIPLLQDSIISSTIVFPSEVRPLLSQHLWSKYEEFFQDKERILRYDNQDANRAPRFMGRLAAVRLLFPEHWQQEVDVSKFPEEVETARRAFAIFFREKNWWWLSQLALSMKIIDAEEVNITDRGLEITMRKPKTDFAPQTPPMPEVRRF